MSFTPPIEAASHVLVHQEPCRQFHKLNRG